MALSEHEQRLLDEIEQTLRTQDPDLASSMRTARPRRSGHLVQTGAITAIVAGFVIVFVGLRLAHIPGTILGVLGYLLIVGGTDLVVQALLVRRRRRARPV
jgi:Flp pilus assembly protein TadB